jgi:Pectate lyase superfamily protein
VAAAIVVIAVAAAWVASVAAIASQPAAVAVQSAAATAVTGGSGARLPYAEVQAENSLTNGTVIGPSYKQGQLADEASGRRAVTLRGRGKYVTFTTPVATNSIDFRYSIPDSSNGSVYSARISLYINGARQPDFTLTNAYSWYYGAYPFTNTPGSDPQHFYDEAHRLFSVTYRAGTKFKLEIEPGDTASSYTLDFADFEKVAPALKQPAGSISVTSKGANRTGAADATRAFNAAIAAAGPGGTVWIPPGTYKIPGHIMVNDVTVAGAGMWYSTVTGTAPGFYGDAAPHPSTRVHLKNFAIFGNVQQRCDSCQVNGIGGAMSDSTVSNIWIEHLKVGAWMDGPMSNLTFSGMRIRDTTADGINLHGGVTDSTITDSEIRNTGDDGIALWSDASIGADSGDKISANTVQLPQLANGIAVYGGNHNTVSGNLVVDSGINQGGGITVAQRFGSTPVGLTTISGNTMIRDGQLDPNWQFGVGALWFDGSQGWGGGPVNVTNALIEQSPFEAIQWVEGTIKGVNLRNVSIIGAGTFALQEQTGGTATATNVTATGVAQARAGKAPSYSCEGSGFSLANDGGNAGISPTQCSGWPTPVFPLLVFPLLGGADRGQALGPEAVGQLLGLRRELRERAGRPVEQQVGEVGVADEGRAVQVGAEHPARVGALGAVAVAGAERRAGQRARPGAERGDALVVLEAGQPADVQRGVHVGDDLADGAVVAATAADVKQAESLHRRVVRPAELDADHLVAGADREHHGAALGRRVQPAVGQQPTGRQRLRQVLAAAHRVDVAVARHRLVGVDLDDLDADAAQPGAALEHEHVPAVTVGGEQVRVDPDQAERTRHCTLPRAVRYCWKAV